MAKSMAMRLRRLGKAVALLMFCLLASRPVMAQAPAEIDPRWGVLAEMAERDFEGQGAVLWTMRWQERNRVLEMGYWSGSGYGSQQFRLDPQSGIITYQAGNLKPRALTSDPGGTIVLQGKRTRFLWREGGSEYKLFSAAGMFLASEGLAWSLYPAGTRGAVATRLAELLNSGKLRPANPDGTVAAAVEPIPPSRPMLAAPPASATERQGPRVALVVGNSTYGGSLGTLANPGNDARLMAAALQAVGFNVELVLDANQRTMKQAIARLGQRLRATGGGATGLFYYAGHGMQSRGANFLIPVGAAIAQEADVDLEAVAADAVLSQMEAAGASTNIVILDACRNTPVVRNFRGGTRGLARMDAPNGSFLSYSTAPGAVALDGTGRNSPFAQALSAELQRPSQPIEITFRNVRRKVLEATSGQQTPWDSSSLIDSFMFKP